MGIKVGIKVMIIDGQADFRSLLMHHVTTHWPDAIVSAYDPTTAGHLPDEFSGAGNDIVLLGNDQGGDREGIDTLRRYAQSPGFPALIYFGEDGEEKAAVKAGADAFIRRNAIRHDELIVGLSDILVARRRVASTSSLFSGDLETGIHPPIRGYRFLKKLSATEHSAVYLAERESADRKVALKVLRQDLEDESSIAAFERFLQEYEMIAEIDHPNIVRIYDLGVADDHSHIAMEYLEGGDLKARIETGMTEPEAVRCLGEIAGALGAIHETGILHRDLKPGNIMFRSDGSVALIDFGLAKRMRLKQEITGGGEIFGTPYYMSPEQGHGGDTDERADIYSLGVLFYEMLTGEKPYRADTAMGIIYKHAHAPLPLLKPCLSRYQALIDTMLAKKPQDRPSTAAEIEEWL